MKHQTTDLIAPENYSSTLKGTVGAVSSNDRLVAAFPSSPIHKGEYDPKQTFIDLVLASDVSNPGGKPAPGLGHWGMSGDYKRDYFVEGASSDFSAPNLLDVEPASGGGPSSPFTPNAASPSPEGIATGIGQNIIVNPAERKASRAPFVGNDADSDPAQPSATSKQHRNTTLDAFNVDPTLSPSWVQGSNTQPPPKGS